MFKYIDSDDSGSISFDEMEACCADEHLTDYLQSINIQVVDVRTLFTLLDDDESGCVNIDEFCDGCVKIKGEAKSFDIHCLLFENKRLVHKWQDYMRYMDTEFLPKPMSDLRDEISQSKG